MLSAQLSAASWASAHQEQRQISLANELPFRAGPIQGSPLDGWCGKDFASLFPFVSSLPPSPISILPSLPCLASLSFFVPSPHAHFFLLSFLITFPAVPLSPSSFIWCLPPLSGAYLLSFALYFSPLCLIPSLCHLASFCLLYTSASVSLSLFSSFSPPSTFLTLSPSILQPLQRQESMV